MAVLNRRTGLVVLALVLAATAWAQAPSQQATTPDRQKPRQPTPMSVHPSGTTAEAEDRSDSEGERRLREVDRRMNRVVRSICNGC